MKRSCPTARVDHAALGPEILNNPLSQLGVGDLIVNVPPAAIHRCWIGTADNPEFNDMAVLDRFAVATRRHIIEWPEDTTGEHDFELAMPGDALLPAPLPEVL